LQNGVYSVGGRGGEQLLNPFGDWGTGQPGIAEQVDAPTGGLLSSSPDPVEDAPRGVWGRAS